MFSGLGMNLGSLSRLSDARARSSAPKILAAARAAEERQRQAREPLPLESSEKGGKFLPASALRRVKRAKSQILTAAVRFSTSG